jgi:hypothetical protein
VSKQINEKKTTDAAERKLIKHTLFLGSYHDLKKGLNLFPVQV